MAGIMNWNQKTDTLRCLESLRAVREPALKIVVVDNGSTDGSAEAIQTQYPEAVVWINKTNRGCAGGRNDLIEYFLRSEMEYLLFLDNDTRILPDCFQRLVEEINRSPDIGVVGVKAYYEDRADTFWSKGGALFDPWRGRFKKLGQREVDRGQYDRSEEVDSIPGGFTFLKRAVAERVSRIDERYFIYFEDSDWCFRVKKAGFRLVTSEKAKVYHKASSSVGMESPWLPNADGDGMIPA